MENVTNPFKTANVPTDNFDTVKVHTISILPWGMVNSFLVVNERSCILVDTGLPDTEQKIEKVLTQLKLSFTDIKLIVITHAHIDHAGNAARVRELSGAPIIAHEGDLPYFRREKPMHFCATGWFGHLFKLTGAIQKPYRAFEPDILISSQDASHQSFDLEQFGFQGKVLSTPGHTEGSLSVILESGHALVGDLIASGILLGGIALKHKAKRPPFEDNPNKVGHELECLCQQGYQTFYMGHGGPLPKDEVLRHSMKLKDIREKEKN